MFDVLFLLLLTVLGAWILRLNRGVTAWITIPLFGMVFSALCVLVMRLSDQRDLLDWQVWTQTGLAMSYAFLDMRLADRFYDRLDVVTGRRHWWQTAPVEDLIDERV